MSLCVVMHFSASLHMLLAVSGIAHTPTDNSKKALAHAQRVAAARASAAARMIGSVPMTNTERIRRWRQAEAPEDRIARRAVATLARRQSRLAERELTRQSVHPRQHAQLTELAPHTATPCEITQVAAILLQLPYLLTKGDAREEERSE